jgi:hypothetical protein
VSQGVIAPFSHDRQLPGDPSMKAISFPSRRERLAFACAVLASSAPLALAQVARNPQEPRNLAVNGSFENPPVDDDQRLVSAGAWSAQAGTIEIVNDAGGLPAVDGHQVLALNSLSVVSQTCSTKAGKNYALSFAYSSRNGPEAAFEVWYGGVLKETVLVPGKTTEGWIQKSYSVVGASTRDKVEFRCLSANSTGVLIDACYLIPFDPSSSSQLLRNGNFENDPRLAAGGSLETPVYIGWSSGWHYDLLIENLGASGDGFYGKNVLHVREKRAVFQQVYVVPLRSYQLRFAFSPGPRDIVDRTFTVSFAGQVLETIFVPRSSSIAWTVRTYTVSAPGPLATVEFKDATDGSEGCLIDAVSLVGPVPEPETGGQVSSYMLLPRTGITLNPGAMFARGITSLGDLDGNGVQDLAVGSVGDDEGADNAGAVWILFLNADRTVRSTQKISELRGGLVADLQKDDGFGRALSSLGDLDGDGIVELAVGANEDDTGAWNAGAVYVLFLTRQGTVRAQHKITALSGDALDYVPGFESNFGAALAGMGDIDGDGIRDMAVGSRYGDSVQVCFLRRDGTVRGSRNITYGASGFTDTATSVSDFFGMSCANMGDFDGDGVNDLLVGAFGRRFNFQNYVGGQYLMLLKRDGTVRKWFYYGSENMNVRTQTLAVNYDLGTSCAGLGDVDGDGVRDLVVGAQREGALSGLEREQTTNQGALYLLLLNANGTIKTCQRIGDRAGGLGLVIPNGARWGESLAPLGDFDGDGLTDLAVGSRFVFGTGAVYFCELLGATREVLLANFTGAPTSGQAPLTVQFTDLSTGPVAEWLWDFGDGVTSSLASPSHTYSTSGLFTVRLTVRDAGGVSHVKTLADYVNVGSGGDLPDGVVKLGCGVNPPSSFRILSGTPRIGTVIIFGVDNPFGTQAAGSIPMIGASWTPTPGSPCGTLVPRRGMSGPTAPGENLIGSPLAFTRLGTAWTGPGNPAPVAYSIPRNTSLIGRTLYVQGRMQDGSAGAAIPIAFADGFALTFRP